MITIKQLKHISDMQSINISWEASYLLTKDVIERCTIFYGAYDGLTLVGVIACSIDVKAGTGIGYHIEAIVIANRYRRQGIGRKMIEHTQDIHGPLSINPAIIRAKQLAKYCKGNVLVD